MDYLRYYANLLFPIAALTGFALGGQWVWLGIATLPLTILADALSPQDYAPRRVTRPMLADTVLYVLSLTAPLVLVAFAWRLSQGFGDTAYPALAYVGAVLTTIWLMVIPNVGAIHELGHRHNWFARTIGVMGFALIGAPMRNISHVQVHHLHFDTPLDHDTGRREESVYGFVARCLVGNTRDELALERKRLAVHGHGLWHWRSLMLWSVLMTAGLLGGMYLATGLPGLAGMAIVLIVTRILGEALNYLQHFGLLRVPGQPIESRHTWNHLSAVTRILGMEITNHVEHHQDPDRTYYNLTPQPQGPQMRNILLWGIAAFFPPLWRRLVQPKLRDWDLNHANAAERALAAEANRRAGWPMWLDGGAPSTPPMA